METLNVLHNNRSVIHCKVYIVHILFLHDLLHLHPPLRVNFKSGRTFGSLIVLVPTFITTSCQPVLHTGCVGAQRSHGYMECTCRINIVRGNPCNVFADPFQVDH